MRENIANNHIIPIESNSIGNNNVTIKLAALIDMMAIPVPAPLALSGKSSGIITHATAPQETAKPITYSARKKTVNQAVDAFNPDVNSIRERTIKLALIAKDPRSEEHTSELQSRGQVVCRPLL